MSDTRKRLRRSCGRPDDSGGRIVSNDVEIVVPGNHLMVALLGPRDRNLGRSRGVPQCHDQRAWQRGRDSRCRCRAGRAGVPRIGGHVQQGEGIDGRISAAQSKWCRPMIDRAGLHRRRPAVGERPHRSPQDLAARNDTSTRSGRTSSRSVSDPPEPERAGSPSLWPCMRSRSKQVQRIILTRPAVEAGERLGFLPGDLMAKVDPYLRPLYDALHDMVDIEGVHKMIERSVVEVAPLAFMRGRTLNNSFIILDEAQNTTPEQMKMFLTRIGFGSKVVVTGDTTQVDVPAGEAGSAGSNYVARYRRLGFRASDDSRHRASPDRGRHRCRLRTGRRSEPDERIEPDQRSEPDQRVASPWLSDRARRSLGANESRAPVCQTCSSRTSNRTSSTSNVGRTWPSMYSRPRVSAVTPS